MFTRTESFREFIRLYPIVTSIVIIHLILYVFSGTFLFPDLFGIERLVGVNLYIANGELWRLISSLFVHNGFSHMFFNSISLILFAPALERMLGKMKFLLLYVGSGIAANVATYYIMPLTYIHVGSSGAIFGLFGYYIFIALFRKQMLSKENSQIIITISALSIIMTFLQPNINITAHIFGFITGVMIGFIFNHFKRG